MLADAINAPVPPVTVIPSVPTSVRLPKEVTPVPPFETGKAVPDNPTAKVPDVVIGLPEIERKAGTVIATDVTEPPPLELNVFQSAALKAPVVVAEASANEMV